MSLLPSIPAAIVAGAIVTPLSLWGLGWIEENSHNPVWHLLWMFFTFFLPMAFAITDTERWWRDGGRYGFFRVRYRRTDWRESYVPAFIRCGVWFVSVVISTLLLRFFGVTL